MELKALIEHRKQFFNDIVSVLNRDVGKLDKYFEQDKYYIKPCPQSTLVDPLNGELLCEVKGEFFEQPFTFLYSIWQVGTKLKIGFLLKDENLIKAFGLDEQSEVLNVWGATSMPSVKLLHGGIFYDWEFDASNLYENYMVQENYSMGIRHMHLRVLKTVYDYIVKQNMEKEYDKNNFNEI